MAKPDLDNYRYPLIMMYVFGGFVSVLVWAEWYAFGFSALQFGWLLSAALVLPAALLLYRKLRWAQRERELQDAQEELERYGID